MEIKFYKCEHCGNIAIKVVDSGVPMICCGEPMVELVAGATDGALEKHVPAVSVEGSHVHVQVGEVAHPMTEAHLIQFIVLVTDKGCQVATLTADNLLALIAKLPGSYAGGAKFAMSTATLFGSIYPLKVGDGAYLFTDAESGGVRRLFGFPVVLDDNIPAGTVLFGNFRYYGVNVPEGVAMEVSRESGFTSGLIDFRALCIADGKPIVPGAFVKLEVTAA